MASTEEPLPAPLPLGMQASQGGLSPTFWDCSQNPAGGLWEAEGPPQGLLWLGRKVRVGPWPAYLPSLWPHVLRLPSLGPHKRNKPRNPQSGASPAEEPGQGCLCGLGCPSGERCRVLSGLATVPARGTTAGCSLFHEPRL